jgi:hypothetical protein
MVVMMVVVEEEVAVDNHIYGVDDCDCDKLPMVAMMNGAEGDHGGDGDDSPAASGWPLCAGAGAVERGKCYHGWRRPRVRRRLVAAH